MPHVAYFCSGGLKGPDTASIDLTGKQPDVPSVDLDVSGDLPSGEVAVKAPDLDGKGGGTSLSGGLMAGAAAAVGVVGAGLSLGGKGDDTDVKVS